MKKVVNMKDFKDVNMHKIEGEDFERLRKIQQEHRDNVDRLKAAMEESHKKLWDAIQEIIGKTKGNMQLDTEFEELGFYVVKKHEDSPLSGLIKILGKD